MSHPPLGMKPEWLRTCGCKPGASSQEITHAGIRPLHSSHVLISTPGRGPLLLEGVSGASVAPRALPSCVTVTLGLCYVPSLSLCAYVGTYTHMPPFHAAPVCLPTRCQCSPVKGGSTRLTKWAGHQEAQHGGRQEVCAGTPLQVHRALNPHPSPPGCSSHTAGFFCCYLQLEPFVESSGERHRALLVGVHVPCGQSCYLYIDKSVLDVLSQ